MKDLKDKGTNNEWCFSMSRTVLQFEREKKEAKVHEEKRETQYKDRLVKMCDSLFSF